MEENKKSKTSSFSKEKILLASIPVIGSIVIAIFLNPNFKCNSKPTPPVVKTSNLRNKAGKVNDMVMFGNYNELYPIFSEYTKQTITRQLFNSVNDSMKIVLGSFIKAVDTTQNIVNGIDYYYVKNQHQNAQSLVTMAFDNNENLVTLLYGPLPKQ